MRPPGLAASSRAAAVAAVLLLARGASAQPPAPSPPRGAIRVEPKDVEVGMLFRGASVRVEGTAPAGWRLALVCVGQEGKVRLKRKAKLWNVLWANVGSVSFERVPSVYLAAADLESGLDPLAVRADLRLGLGYDGVEAQVLPANADEDTRRLFRELVKLKEGEGLYSYAKLRPESASGEAEIPHAVLLARLERFAPPTRLSAEFSLPASVPPGEYEIRLIGYRDGTGEILASEKLTARRVGLVLLVSALAARHGFLYGILSVVLAIAAGFLSGVLFAGARKGH